MRDSRLDKLADVLVRYSTGVKPGDLVTLIADPSGMPAVEAVCEAVVRAGGHPSFHPRSEALAEIVLRHGSDAQIAHLSPFEMFRVEKCDVQIVLWNQINTRYLARIDSRKTALAQSSRKPFMKTFMARSAKRELRWCGTEIPNQASAQDADMSITDYSDFVFRAGLLHLPDPVAAWQKVHEKQEKVRAYLQGKRTVRFVAPADDGSKGGRKHEGTDLTVEVGKSTWINCAGKENFPDGEVFAGPQGADGVVNYTFPAVYGGKEVEGVRLRFKGGRVVEASAVKNEDYLIKMLDQDAGARTMGEIAIGTNYQIKEFSKNTLFDEKIGGTFHAAVGAGYPESGSSNESGLHWDMVCNLRPMPHLGRAGGTIAADGEVFHRDGLFVFQGWPGSE
jgi:aminopeptidase